MLFFVIQSYHNIANIIVTTNQFFS